jgi:hypothetical protein
MSGLGPFRARPSLGFIVMLGPAGLLVLGMLWPGAIIEDIRWLQAVAALSTVAWLYGVVVLVRAQLTVSRGILQARMMRTQRVDLNDLRWVALSPEAPEPRTADAAGYQQWVVMLGDGAGRVAQLPGPVPFQIWARTRELLGIIVEAVEASGAMISERNWAMLRRQARLEPAPLPQAVAPEGAGGGWVRHFEWNRKTAERVATGIALIGIWPLAWALIAAMDGLVGLPTVVAVVLAVVMLGYAWRHQGVARRRGVELHPDGTAVVIRRVGFLKLQLVEERVDLTAAVDVQIQRVREVIRQGFRWTLTVRDAAGGSAVLPLGEGLVPPRQLWVQASELLERSGAAIPAEAAQEIERLTGRRPGNPNRT